MTPAECAPALLGGISVEIEMPARAEVMKILTSSDGRVEGMLGPFKTPLFFEEWAAKRFPNRNPRKLRWEQLDVAQQKQLTGYVALSRRQEFFRDRALPNLQVKPRIRVEFKQPTRFLGKDYPRGGHWVKVPDIKNPQYRRPDDMVGLKGVELHLRSGDRLPSEVIDDAWSFQRGIGMVPGYLHAHLVAPIPVASLLAQREATGLAIAEFFRRANLLAEMSYASRGFPLKTTREKDGSAMLFNGIYPSFLSAVYRYFMQLDPVGTRLKMGFIGFRGEDFYDEDGVYGLEYRAIGIPREGAFYRAFADRLLSGMRGEDYGFSAELMPAWLQEVHGLSSFATRWRIDAVESALESTWYRTPAPLMLATTGMARLAAQWVPGGSRLLKPLLIHDWGSDSRVTEDPESLKRIQAAQWEALRGLWQDGRSLDDVMPAFLRDSGLPRVRLGVAGEETGEFGTKMLFHDWAQDPLVFQDPALLTRIREAQVRGLAELLAGEGERPAIMQRFVRKSGLLERLAQGFGLAPEAYGVLLR